METRHQFLAETVTQHISKTETEEYLNILKIIWSWNFIKPNSNIGIFTADVLCVIIHFYVRGFSLGPQHAASHTGSLVNK